MIFDQISKSLTSEQCGLYLLAGWDEPGTLTIHAAQGAISQENENYIRQTIAAIDAGCEVVVRYHASQDLYSPLSLECFANLFGHDQIASDPTGSFARVSGLTKLANALRTEFKCFIDRILWQAETSRLIVVTADCTDDGISNTPKVDHEWLHDQIKSLMNSQANGDLSRTVASIRICSTVPPGKYTPVDFGSYSVPVPLRKPHGFARLVARVAGLAALFGLGMISTVNAKTPATIEADHAQLPGITALVGLTTLGENSYGLRNRYQAIGGLRLYFGDAGKLMTAAFGAGRIKSDPLTGSESDKEVPVRVAYG